MPSLYCPDQYLNDLGVFNQGKGVPEHGPFWKLCGMMAGNLFEPEKVKHFASPSDFLCCLYFLNLLNQGIYTYFRERHANWLDICAPFVDILGCSYGHGGWTHSPDSILRFARNPSYIPRAQPVEITANQLRSYTQFFFFEYLEEGLFATQHQYLFSPDELLKRLKDDVDSRSVLFDCQRQQ